MAWFWGKQQLLFILLVISIIGNVMFYLTWRSDDPASAKVTGFAKAYPLLSKRILRDPMTDIRLNFLTLRQKLHASVEPYKDSFAFYFEYLPTGTSIGVNEDSEFTAASLLKVPVVVAYYYKKERLGISQDATVKIKKNELNSKFGQLYKKGEGYKVNLADAVRLALTESDNTASLVLADQISNEDFKSVYEGLDIPMALQGDSPIITAQQYTSILKALYFSSLLNKEDSESILELMTKSKFNSMLPAGVPENISVAHKIGLIDKQIYQDCGIVYVPNRPYVLCMISKSDRKTASQRMKAMSSEVYKYVAATK